MMPALTPALFPRKGSAEVSFGFRAIYAASENLSSAATDIDLTEAVVVPPLLGVRADQDSSISVRNFVRIHHV